MVQTTASTNRSAPAALAALQGRQPLRGRYADAEVAAWLRALAGSGEGAARLTPANTLPAGGPLATSPRGRESLLAASSSCMAARRRRRAGAPSGWRPMEGRLER
jgi:hypothetical protein